MVATFVGEFIYVVWDQSVGFFVDRCEPSAALARRSSRGSHPIAKATALQ